MDTVSKKTRSRIMSAIRSKHTKPELALRKELRKHGINYRLHYGKEKIDIAIPSKKVAIFVDGCFWHGCPKHGHKPKSRIEERVYFLLMSNIDLRYVNSDLIAIIRNILK